MGFEQLDDLLRVLADPRLELRSIGVEALADVLQRRDDLILEPLDVGAERPGHVFDASRQRGVDVRGEPGQAFGQRIDAVLQGLADLGRLGVQPLNDLATAFAEHAGGFEGVARQHFRHRAAAQREALVDAVKQGFDRAGDVAQLGRSPLVEGLETPFELCGRLFVAAAQLLADGAAPGDERLLDGRELRCEIVRQRVRALADLHDEFAAAPVDGALETREPVAERDFDPPGVRGEGGVDRIEVGRRDRLELPETLGGLGREVFEVRVEPRVEVVAARPHHRIDRIDVACEFCVQLVGVRNDPVGHAVSVFADQVVERFQIVAHASGLLGQRLDQPAAALADDGVEGRHLRAQRVVNAARAGRDGRGGLASQCDEPLGDLRGARVQAGERRGGRLLDLGLRGRALDGNRSHDPLGRIVHQGLENGGVAVDGAAQLGLSRVETLGPPRGRGLERRRRILGALPQHRSEPLARSVQPIAQGRATLDQRLVKAFGDAAEPLDQIVALPADGVGQARLASLDPVHQRQRPLREVARHRVVRFDKASRDRLALGPDRLDGFRAAGAEAADDGVGVALDGVPHDRRGLGEPVLHRISLDLDGFSRFGEPGRNGVAMAPQRRDDVGAARVRADRPPFRHGR